jgi:hypothetical protein
MFNDGKKELEAQINIIKNKISNSNTESNSISDEKVISEICERQKRASNLMFYNVSDDSAENAARVSDLEKVKSVLRDITNEDLNIMKTIRVGNVNKNGCRPLKVIFRYQEDVIMVLKNKKKIKKDKKIFLDADLTPMQASRIKKLKEELNNRKTNGENVTIICIKMENQKSLI